MIPAIYFIELNETGSFEQFEPYIIFLSQEKQAKIRRLRRDADKKLSLLSDLFIRFLSCKALGISNGALQFCKNEHGKPSIYGAPFFQYNISHTKNAVAVSLSEKPTGVDVEKIKPLDMKIARRFFCANEFDYIQSGEENRERRFFEVWTKKEAYVKWLGKGLSVALDSFDITEPAVDRLFSTTAFDPYIVSVCGEYEKPAFQTLTEDMLLKMLFGFFRP